MAVNREQLYEAVWSRPAGQAAKEFEVSGSFLARVCRQLNVPRPPRGYWVKLKYGKAPPKPPLAAAQPGDSLEWRRDGMPCSRVPPTLPEPPAAAPPRRRHVSVPQRHPLVWGVQPSFEATRTGHTYSSEGLYLRPYKRTLPDIFVSMEQLAKALDFANDLYRYLEARGHRVVLAPNDGHWYTRPHLAYDGKTRTQYWDREPWSPRHPTLAFFGSVAIGLTVYEPAEQVEARWVDDKPVRLSEVPPPARGTRLQVHHSTSTWSLPSRRLSVRAYSPYPGTAWVKVWHGPGLNRRISLASIHQELVEAAAPIATQVAEAERKRKEQAERERVEEHRRRIAHARDKMAEAVKSSRADLLATIESWSFAMRVEQFFETLASTATSLPCGERDALAARVAKAREFLGGATALQRFQEWRVPSERLRPEELDLLKQQGGDQFAGEGVV